MIGANPWMKEINLSYFQQNGICTMRSGSMPACPHETILARGICCFNLAVRFEQITRAAAPSLRPI